MSKMRVSWTVDIDTSHLNDQQKLGALVAFHGSHLSGKMLERGVKDAQDALTDHGFPSNLLDASHATIIQANAEHIA